jgi:hypothetical protein
MAEEDYIHKIAELSRLASGSETPIQVFREIEEALSVYPDSPSLWCMRGDLIQLGPEDSPYSLEDALRSYEKALTINPVFAEAHESIGYYSDVIDGDLVRAEAAFLEAVRCGGGESSVAGLARVRSERGHPTSDILTMIDQHDVKHSPVLQKIREEIASGMWQLEPPNENA